MWVVSKFENPNTAPPASAGQNLPVTLRHNTNAAQPDTGSARAASRLNETTEPNMTVIGAVTSASGGMVVAQARLAPNGTSTCAECRGLSPCAIAYGHQRSAQT